MFNRTLEQRKNYIARMAAKVFADKGYMAASLQDIAKKSSISKAGIYHYFRTKEEILYHIINITNERFLQVLESSICDSKAQGLSPEESFRRLIVTYATFINKEKDVRLLVLRERHQLTGKYKRGLREIERKLFRTLKRELEKIPNIDKKANHNVITFLIIAMSHWMGYWLGPDGELSMESAIDQNINIIFHGFCSLDRR